MPQPTLTTERLVLRPFTLADAPDVQRLAGAREVAATTQNIPHPYEAGMAEQWISTHAEAFANDKSVTFAITQREDGALCGAIGLNIHRADQHAEMGYWMGLPYWNHGYTSEAARAVVQYGFEVLDLHRIFARHMTRNPASGRVMQKMGMTYEGTMRQHILKWGMFEDIAFYGLLRDEWRAAQL